MISSKEFKNIVKKPSPTNHVFVLDCSGSMYGTLPRIKDHLKSNLSLLVKEKDTVSVLYFASKGQYGTVFAGQEITSLDDLSEINKLIDKYVRTMGCTGFVEPLQLAMDTAKGIQNGNLNSLIFMTDGYDNEWREADILKVCEKLPLVFSDITFLEYGWYCNRPLLEKMSEATNANHLFTESYADYEPVFEETMRSVKSSRREIDIDAGTTHLVYCDDNKIVVNKVDGVKAYIPEHIDTIYTIDGDLINDIVNIDDEQLLYIALYFAAYTNNPDLVWKVLSVLGDVKLINQFNNSFSKQDKSNFRDAVNTCVFSHDARFVDGRNCSLVPDENAYTIIDLINTLVDGKSLIDTNSDDFSYNRIGRGTVQKEDDTIDLLTEQIANEPDKDKRKALALQLAEAEEWTPKFTETGDGIVDMASLVTNASRPNLNILTRQDGFVEVPEEFQNKFKLPAKLDTFRWRNYNIVKDGIVNMKKLPVIINRDVLNEIYDKVDMVFTENNWFTMEGIEPDRNGNFHLTIDLTSLPLINRGMVKNISGEEFASLVVDLEILKAKKKVFDFYYKELNPFGKSQGIAELYGADAVAYLHEKGIRDYGFAPKVTREESTDFYMTVELNAKIKGASSLPSVNAVVKKIAEGKKLNTADLMMKLALDEYNSFVVLDTIKNSKVKDTLILEWLKSETETVIQLTRDGNKKIGKLMYGIVVGHTWFSDFDEDQTDVKINNALLGDIEVSLLLEEKQEKI